MSSNKANRWYYSIELAPGERTSGRDHTNLSVTRAQLRGVDLKGTRCLDLGTQEGVVPVLLLRSGAQHVVAYDRMRLEERVERVKKGFNVEFDYVAGMNLDQLSKALPEQTLFDLVVFSGVLYHMINPLGGLATARRFCRAGGLFLIETVVANRREANLLFNARGELYGAYGNYFVPTTGWLDYVLRMLGLEPVRFSFIRVGDSEDLLRLAVLCRSHDQPCPLDPDDRWASREFHDRAWGPDANFHWSAIASTLQPVPLTDRDPGVTDLADHSLFDSIREASPRPFSIDELRLNLDSSM